MVIGGSSPRVPGVAGGAVNHTGWGGALPGIRRYKRLRAAAERNIATGTRGAGSFTYSLAGPALGVRSMEPCHPAPCPVCPAWFGSRWERKSRKKASANIFQDVNLGQMEALFRKSGDENADERARIIWEKDKQTDQDITQALMELKSKKTQLFFQHNRSGAEFLGLIWVKAFNKLR